MIEEPIRDDFGIKNPASDIIKRAAKENVVHDILFGISLPSENVASNKIANLLQVKLDTWNSTYSLMTQPEQKFLKSNFSAFTEYYNGIKNYGNMYISYYFGNKKEIPLGFGVYDKGLTLFNMAFSLM